MYLTNPPIGQTIFRGHQAWRAHGGGPAPCGLYQAGDAVATGAAGHRPGAAAGASVDRGRHFQP